MFDWIKKIWNKDEEKESCVLFSVIENRYYPIYKGEHVMKIEATNINLHRYTTTNCFDRAVKCETEAEAKLILDEYHTQKNRKTVHVIDYTPKTLD